MVLMVVVMPVVVTMVMGAMVVVRLGLCGATTSVVIVVVMVVRMVPGCVPDGARGTDHRGRGDGVGEPGLGRAADQPIFREPDKNM